MIDGMEGVEACRIPDRALSEILRVLEGLAPNTTKMLRAHLKALNEELVQALGHDHKPRDPIEEGIARSQRGKE